jgi:hypothetical protein
MTSTELSRDTVMQSGRTWGEVQDQEERIRGFLESNGLHRGDEGFEDLVCLVQCREILVEKMGTAKPFSRLWDELSREIVEIECKLAKHGLV